MSHPALVCHPASACPPIRRLTAHLEIPHATAGAISGTIAGAVYGASVGHPFQEPCWRLHFRIEGAIDQLLIPDRKQSRRADGLWQHTCFEAFVRTADAGDAYHEFNFSPSGEWAAYRFDSYRHGMAPADMNAPHIAVRCDRESLDLEALWIPPPELREAQRGMVASLAAVIEDRGERVSYWALRHAARKPDFHQRDSFVLQLPSSSAAV